MRGRLIGISELTGREQGAWRELAATAADPNPLAEPDCVLAAARHLPYGASIALAVAEDAGDFAAVTPVRRVRGRGRFLVPLVTTNIRRMTYLGSPLVAADPVRGRGALRALLLALAERRSLSRWLCFVVQWLAESTTSSLLHQALVELGYPVFVTEDFEQPFLYRCDDAGAYTRTQSKRHLSDYRRRARRLSDLLGGELEVVNRAGQEEAVEEFIALEAAGYKTERGVAMTTQVGEAEYFKDMCRRFASEGRLHHLCLEAAGRTIAMQLSLEADPGMFLIKVSHDEEFARFDPGVQLHLRAMEYFHHQTKAEWIDVCTFAGNDLLLRLYPDRRRTTTLLCGLGGRLDSALVAALPAARRASRSAQRRVSHLQQGLHKGAAR